MKVAAIQMVSAIAREANLARAHALLARGRRRRRRARRAARVLLHDGRARHRQARAARDRRRRHGAGLPGRRRARVRPVDRRRHAAARDRRRDPCASTARWPSRRTASAWRATTRSTCSSSTTAASATTSAASSRPAPQPVCFDLPSRDGHRWRIGMSVCYDLRFPELYRALARQGAELLLVPSAFTHTTGAGALGGAAARPRHREPGLGGRAGAGRHARERPPAPGASRWWSIPGARWWRSRPTTKAWCCSSSTRSRSSARARNCPRSRTACSDAGVLDSRCPPPARCRRAFARLRFCARLWQRWFLWVLLAVLVLALLVTVVWLAGRHEVEQVQTALDRDTADAVSRPAQRPAAQRAEPARARRPAAPDARALDARSRGPAARAPRMAAARMARCRRCARSAPSTRPTAAACSTTPSRGADQSDVALACAAARKLGAPAYSPSHYVPLAQGGGLEVMELCLPVDGGGYLVATYSLRDTLIELVAPTLHARPGGRVHRGRRHAPGGRRRAAPRAAPACSPRSS